ncbi:MAG TPA: RluA family pseudouridine synthase, partial [Verrucomicrobiae bacterium]|nr:RluA family pseudouridine synthase [Verrucomicrobiae bacterium]
LYEDRSILAVDKPAGWMLAPSDWDRTGRNLQLALTASIGSGDFWARSRNLKFLRFIHRLDAETTGVLLWAKSAGAVPIYSRLFETRAVEKSYYAIAEGSAAQEQWTVRSPIASDPSHPVRMRIDPSGRDAVTNFSVVNRTGDRLLVRANPVTGRTHQIRVHLQKSGLPILGDQLYGSRTKSPAADYPFALRAASLTYPDPFSRRKITVSAPMDRFLKAFGFAAEDSTPPRTA